MCKPTQNEDDTVHEFVIEVVVIPALVVICSDPVPDHFVPVILMSTEKIISQLISEELTKPTQTFFSFHRDWDT